MRLRGGVIHLRKRVPADIRSIIGKGEVWRSLQTADPKVAVRRSHRAWGEIEAMFEQARAGLRGTGGQTILRPFGKDDAENVGSDYVGQIASLVAERLQAAVPVAQLVPTNPLLTFRDAYARYMSDPTQAWSRRTKIAHKATRAIALSIIGEDMPINQITRAHCRDLIDVLQRIPRSASKRFPHLSPREAADRMGPKCDPSDRMSVANINAYLNKLGTFFNWAELDELIARNPAKGMRLADTVRKKDKRHPFSPKQLQTIFNAPLYRGCVDDGHGYAKVGNERPKGTRFWVPLLGLYTGMRLNEICQLETTDVMLMDGSLCIRVSNDSPDEDSDKRLKTRSSERIVPVHHLLLECGFTQFVADRRRSGDQKLFADILIDANGFRSTAFSKWFIRFLQQAGATADSFVQRRNSSGETCCALPAAKPPRTAQLKITIFKVARMWTAPAVTISWNRWSAIMLWRSPIANVVPMRQHRAMFDWSDLLLLLPSKVFWVLMGLFCACVGCVLIWARPG